MFEPWTLYDLNGFEVEFFRVLIQSIIALIAYYFFYQKGAKDQESYKTRFGVYYKYKFEFYQSIIKLIRELNLSVNKYTYSGLGPSSELYHKHQIIITEINNAEHLVNAKMFEELREIADDLSNAIEKSSFFYEVTNQKNRFELSPEEHRNKFFEHREHSNELREGKISNKITRLLKNIREDLKP